MLRLVYLTQNLQLRYHPGLKHIDGLTPLSSPVNNSKPLLTTRIFLSRQWAQHLETEKPFEQQKSTMWSKTGRKATRWLLAALEAAPSCCPEPGPHPASVSVEKSPVSHSLTLTFNLTYLEHYSQRHLAQATLGRWSAQIRPQNNPKKKNSAQIIFCAFGKQEF